MLFAGRDGGGDAVQPAQGVKVGRGNRGILIAFRYVGCLPLTTLSTPHFAVSTGIPCWYHETGPDGADAM